jgi:glycerophosphoryl diester phosphodiesterase
MSASICLQPDGSEIKKGDDQKLFNIYQMSYEDIRGFDCGSLGNERFPEQVKMRVSKPLLKDVIVAVEDHIKSYSQYEVDYNIEIKSSPEGDNKFHPAVNEFSDLVYNLIDEYLPMNRVVIQSFDFRVLQYWHKKYPDVRLAALVENTKSVQTNIANLGFSPAVYSPYYKLLKRDDVDYLHKQKIRIIPWTVNEENEMLSMRGLGVDGIITDYPDRARKYKMTLSLPR